MPARPVHIDPETGLPDLVKRLTDDSKRLVKDEVRLAKIEASEATKSAAKGAMWMGVAFGIGVVMLIAFTIALATGIGQIANGNMWVGALLTGAIEIAIGLWLIKRGVSAFAEPSYTFEETRAGLKEAASFKEGSTAGAHMAGARSNGGY